MFQGISYPIHEEVNTEERVDLDDTTKNATG